MNPEYNTCTGAGRPQQNSSTSQAVEPFDGSIGRFQIIDFKRRAIVIPAFAIFGCPPVTESQFQSSGTTRSENGSDV